MGRFLTKDTVAGVNSIPKTLDLYAYTGNNPVTSIDPDGKAYIDFNLTWGLFGGVYTCGIAVDHKGRAWQYTGKGVGTPGFSWSLTFSTNDIGTGQCTAMQGSGFAALQLGWLTDPSKDGFAEVGFGGLGLSKVGYYVEPAKIPTEKAKSLDEFISEDNSIMSFSSPQIVSLPPGTYVVGDFVYDVKSPNNIFVDGIEMDMGTSKDIYNWFGGVV